MLTQVLLMNLNSHFLLFYKSTKLMLVCQESCIFLFTAGESVFFVKWCTVYEKQDTDEKKIIDLIAFTYCNTILTRNSLFFYSRVRLTVQRRISSCRPAPKELYISLVVYSLPKYWRFMIAIEYFIEYFLAFIVGRRNLSNICQRYHMWSSKSSRSFRPKSY